MKKYMITGLAVLLTIVAQAQTTMDEVLRQVETQLEIGRASCRERV